MNKPSRVFFPNPLSGLEKISPDGITQREVISSIVHQPGTSE